MRFFLLGLTVGLCFLLFFFTLGMGGRTEQPIAFNHKLHQQQGIECLTCHPHYKDQTFSGMPALAICLECHKEPLTKSVEEEKIRQFEKKGQEIPWRHLYGQPDHVFFSHRRHVTLGKLECQQCHGNIGQSEKPPASPWVKMTMAWCMDCHTQRRVTNDCLACHV
jgi:menaquinone reductase, multiheme cytochrome c subunit